MVLALINHDGYLEYLPLGTCPTDVFEQGTVHEIKLERGAILYWGWTCNLQEVNESASLLAKQAIKGDACIQSATFEDIQDRLNRVGQSTNEWIRRKPHLSPSFEQLNLTQRTEPYMQASFHISSVSSSDQLAVCNLNACSSSLESGLTSFAPHEDDHISRLHRSEDSEILESSNSTNECSSAPCQEALSSTSPCQEALSSTSPWQDAPDSILCLIATALPPHASFQIPLFLTCKGWRIALSTDTLVLERIWFNLNPLLPFKWQPSSAALRRDSNGTLSRFILGFNAESSLGPSLDTRQPLDDFSHEARTRRHQMESSSGTFSRAACSHIPMSSSHNGLGGVPYALTAAAAAGNSSAVGTLAQLYEVMGLHSDAMRLWRKAAKAGDLEGMFKIGLAMYQGAKGVELDVEDACMWLTKALKRIFAVNNLSQIRLDVLRSPGAVVQQHEQPNLSARTTPAHWIANTLEMMDLEEEQLAALLPMVSRAAVVLGYQHYDGEGVKTDLAEACRMFKLAAACGSKEGEQVLGWMWNTGQF
ncbi:hypothetical protein CEUSTIGMA_g4916.t1 [Chlamydomonas eustigma]|uniref:F-box domain-containing protein n=1 Tax=Chlamydomonas eustigma TaxID=1157962 RepID=A0A250X3J1_9CHLO|nr:hypothetical protein CEUSTIGMA_g4916.t1 [Chlamydomonas eustigma]|eukprot:GAX77472.1 hypothetical protein CEUSTIGMA_g4916.t1 [Chlamydomonas eustigma]